MHVTSNLKMLNQNRYLKRGLITAALVGDSHKLIDPLPRRQRLIKGRDTRTVKPQWLAHVPVAGRRVSSLDVLLFTLSAPIILLTGAMAIAQQMHEQMFQQAAVSSAVTPVTQSQSSAPGNFVYAGRDVATVHTGVAPAPKRTGSFASPLTAATAINCQPLPRLSAIESVASTRTAMEVMQIGSRLSQENQLQAAADLYIAGLSKYPDDAQLRVQAVRALIAARNLVEAKLICMSSLHPILNETEHQQISDLLSDISQ